MKDWRRKSNLSTIFLISTFILASKWNSSFQNWEKLSKLHEAGKLSPSLSIVFVLETTKFFNLFLTLFLLVARCCCVFFFVVEISRTRKSFLLSRIGEKGICTMFIVSPFFSLFTFTSTLRSICLVTVL